LQRNNAATLRQEPTMTTATTTTTTTTTARRPVPVLKIDGVLYDDRPMPDHCRLERKALWSILGDMADKGWKAFRTNDGDRNEAHTDDKSVMEVCFNLDECWVAFRNEAGDKHTIFLVFGNSPNEIVCDWGFTVGDPDGFDAAITAATDAIQTEEFFNR
jgi:hypothetical protein